LRAALKPRPAHIARLPAANGSPADPVPRSPGGQPPIAAPASRMVSPGFCNATVRGRLTRRNLRTPSARTFRPSPILSTIPSDLRGGAMSSPTDAASVDVPTRGDDPWRLLLESVRDVAIILLDRDGRITGWNSGAEWIFGYPDDE